MSEQLRSGPLLSVEQLKTYYPIKKGVFFPYGGLCESGGRGQFFHLSG